MHTYIKICILAFLQSRGTSPVLMEDWKIVVWIGAVSVDSSLSSRGLIWSGLQAL